MALEEQYISNTKTLWELSKIAADAPEEQAILDLLVKLAEDSLPYGWSNWKISNYDLEDLTNVSSSLLNKLRYGLPTLGIARAFNQNATSLPEKVFREYKVRMLKFPFCIGLIISPQSLSCRIRGSKIQHELVVAALESLKPLLVSRETAAFQLSQKDSDKDTSDEENLPPPKKERRMDRLERQQDEMRLMLTDFINSFQDKNKHEMMEEVGSDEGEEMDYDKENWSDTGSRDESETWIPPSLEITSGHEPKDFDFDPKTIEQEPAIPAPSKKMEKFGIECQKLGTNSFNKIRHLEIQKKFKAFPVFNDLKINPQLNIKGQAMEELTKSDCFTAYLSHGLLLQREAFLEGLKKLVELNPDCRENAQSLLWSDNANFKSLSDNLLQLTCGRRAEIIEQRRKMVKPNSAYITSLLKNIPPSTTHLFEEKEFSEFYRQHYKSFRTPFKRTIKSNYKHPQFKPSKSNTNFPRSSTLKSNPSGSGIHNNRKSTTTKHNSYSTSYPKGKSASSHKRQ